MAKEDEEKIEKLEERTIPRDAQSTWDKVYREFAQRHWDIQHAERQLEEPKGPFDRGIKHVRPDPPWV